MSKTDPIKRRELPDGSVVCESIKYARVEDLPPDPEAPVVALRLHHCFETPAAAEYTPGFPRVTGRYEGASYTCCINQAGYHLVLWLSPLPAPSGSAAKGVGPLSTAPRTRSVHRYEADYNLERGWFDVHDKFDPGRKVGVLRVEDGGGEAIVALEWNAEVAHDDDKLRRFDDRATLSDGAVAAIRGAGLDDKDPLIAGMLEEEHAPVSEMALRALETYLKDVELEELLRALIKVEPSHSNTNRAEIKDRIDAIEDALRTEIARHFSASHRVALPWHARRILIAKDLTLVTHDEAVQTRTLYEWLQIVIHWDDNFTLGAARKLPAIETWLGVEPPKPHRYKLHLDAAGYRLEAGIPFSKKVADAVDKAMKEVEKRSPVGKQVLKRGTKWITNKLQWRAGGRLLSGFLTITYDHPSRGWTHTYAVHFWLASVGLGGGKAGRVDVTATGWAETGIEWQAPDFSGVLAVMSGQLGRDRTGKLADKQMIWVVDGRGPDATIQLTFDRVEGTSDADSLGYGDGEISDPLEKTTPPKRKHDFKFVDYSVAHGNVTTTHFVLGSATVLDPGRHALRVFAANELAALRDGVSSVAIEGFADRLGRRWYNDVLSHTRAWNARQALKDCLGTDLAAEVTIHAHGERALEALDGMFHFPDKSPSPEWRRVFVILNGQAGVSLVVPDKRP